MQSNFALKGPGRNCGAFTIAELVVATALIVLVGGIVYSIYGASQVLFGRNLATNVSTEASRRAFDHLSRDLHANVGPTQLINASLASVSGNGPSAGVTVRTYIGGPCILKSDISASGTSLVISPSPGMTPTAGDLVSLPAFRLERVITNVSSSGVNWNLTLASSLGQAFNATGSVNYAAFVTRRVALVVVGSDLRRYANLSAPGSFTTLARGVTSAQPFSFPVVGGVADKRYLNVALSNTNSAFSQRRWASVDSLVNYTVAYRTPTSLTTQ